MKISLWQPEDQAQHDMELNNNGAGYIALDGKKRNVVTGEQMPWVYLYTFGDNPANAGLTQVGDCHKDYFVRYFLEEEFTVDQNADKVNYNVTVKEIMENEYTVEASDFVSALKLATKGRLGIRLTQKLTGFNVTKVRR